jgi:hypothetical protein
VPGIIGGRDRGGGAALSGGDWALVILAVFWAVLVVFLAIVAIHLFRVLDSTRQLLDGLRSETVPMLSDVRTTVQSVNRELDRTDVILASAGTITRRVERITGLVDEFVSLPLIKAISFAAGAGRAVKRFQGEP